jgi:hypothetical protein
MSEDFAYRLGIRIAPQWGVICEKVMPPPTMEDEHAAFLAKLKDNAETDRMLNRTYDFTEFFDSRSGLTMRFQQTNTGKTTYSGVVSEFADRGYLLGWGDPLKSQNKKHAIEVTEFGIRNECFDEFIGGVSPLMDGEHFFTIPLEAMLEFSIALQLRFPEAKHHAIVKWLDKIEAAFKSKGTSYKARFDYEPDMMKLEEEDPEFFIKHGRPQVATTEAFPTSFNSECAFYALDVEVFTRNRARRHSRLAFTSFFNT